MGVETQITASNLPYKRLHLYSSSSVPSVRSVRPDSLDRPLKILPVFLPSTTNTALKIHSAAPMRPTKPKEIFVCFSFLSFFYIPLFAYLTYYNKHNLVVDSRDDGVCKQGAG